MQYRVGLMDLLLAVVSEPVLTAWYCDSFAYLLLVWITDERNMAVSCAASIRNLYIQATNAKTTAATGAR